MDISDGLLRVANRCKDEGILRALVDTDLQPVANETKKSKKTKRRRKARKKSLSDRLVDSLTKAKEQSLVPHPPGKFIPEGQLKSLVKQSSVEFELQRFLSKRRLFKKRSVEAQSIQYLAKKICPEESEPLPSGEENNAQVATPRTYRKVFVILLFIKKEHKIESFVNEEICDQDLPLVQQRNSSQLARKAQPDAPLQCFVGWKKSRIDQFEECQWTVLAPVFINSDGSSFAHQELDSREILPFTTWQHVAGGKSGIVYKTKIHGEHHELISGEVLLPARMDTENALTTLGMQQYICNQETVLPERQLSARN